MTSHLNCVDTTDKSSNSLTVSLLSISIVLSTISVTVEVQINLVKSQLGDYLYPFMSDSLYMKTTHIIQIDNAIPNLEAWFSGAFLLNILTKFSRFDIILKLHSNFRRSKFKYMLPLIILRIILTFPWFHKSNLIQPFTSKYSPIKLIHATQT